MVSILGIMYIAMYDVQGMYGMYKAHHLCFSLLVVQLLLLAVASVPQLLLPLPPEHLQLFRVLCLILDGEYEHFSRSQPSSPSSEANYPVLPALATYFPLLLPSFSFSFPFLKVF